MPRPTPRPAPRATAGEDFAASVAAGDDVDDAAAFAGVDFDDAVEGAGVDCVPAPIMVIVVGKPLRLISTCSFAHANACKYVKGRVLTLKLKIQTRIRANNIITQARRHVIPAIIPIHAAIRIALGHAHPAYSCIVAHLAVHAERGAFIGGPVLVGTGSADIERGEFADVGRDVFGEDADVVGETSVAGTAAGRVCCARVAGRVVYFVAIGEVAGCCDGGGEV
jgi:hypothetical protein